MDWRSGAACLTADPELFFPLTDQGPSRWQVREALEICSSCTVREACKNWALDNDIHHGVWGGTTEEERRTLRRRRQVRQDLDSLTARYGVAR
jgi:WhiB family redox-sensing transcriptional regulator